MGKKIVAAMMMGMNYSNWRDPSERKFRFAMERFAHLPRIVQPEVLESGNHYLYSSLFFEVCRAVEELREMSNLAFEDVFLIFGRGRLGEGSERRFKQSLERACRWFEGEEPFKIVICKSYGCVDALEGLLELDTNPPPAWLRTIDLLVLIDGAAPSVAIRPVLEHERIKVPSFAQHTYAFYQQEEGSHVHRGRPAVAQAGVWNFKLTRESYTPCFYSGYASGERRELAFGHEDMEEIASVQRHFRYKGEESRPCTLGELIKAHYNDL